MNEAERENARLRVENALLAKGVKPEQARQISSEHVPARVHFTDHGTVTYRRLDGTEYNPAHGAEQLARDLIEEGAGQPKVRYRDMTTGERIAYGEEHGFEALSNLLNERT